MRTICFRLYKRSGDRVLFYSCDTDSTIGNVENEPREGHIFLRTIQYDGEIYLESFSTEVVE